SHCSHQLLDGIGCSGIRPPGEAGPNRGFSCFPFREIGGPSGPPPLTRAAISCWRCRFILRTSASACQSKDCHAGAVGGLIVLSGSWFTCQPTTSCSWYQIWYRMLTISVV